jgi:hypothetical protein
MNHLFAVHVEPRSSDRPSSLARRMPARTRSMMRHRSSSAMALTMTRIARCFCVEDVIALSAK